MYLHRFNRRSQLDPINYLNGLHLLQIHKCSVLHSNGQLCIKIPARNNLPAGGLVDKKHTLEFSEIENNVSLESWSK